MIVKELDPFVDTGDTFTRAGHHAEKQMAHYLHRAFGDNEKVWVLNGLRLERNGDTAQIDHLIIHRAGMVIIESKSVHGTVRVNEQGEWMRVYGSRREGMPSPIEQANRQAKFLKGFLNAHAPQIGGKLLGLFQTRFSWLTVDVVVAVSDTGIIERPVKRQLSEVCKADQAPTKVKELIATHKQEARSFKIDFEQKRGRELSRSELDNLIAFLPAHHAPFVARSAPIPVAEAPAVYHAKDAEVLVAPMNLPRGTSGPVCRCVTCEKPLTPKEELYCRENATRFGGAFYCYPHQRYRRAARNSAPHTSRA